MRSLDRLLRPKTVAVIGGGTWCENVVRTCRKTGFQGELWAIHPTRSEVAGCPAVRSVSHLPSIPDAVFVGVNRHASVDVIRELSARGGGGAVCFASGFSEANGELVDGSDLQAALVQAAGNMPVIGPNCYGFINALDNVALWPDQHGLTTVDRGVAIISQSSNIALNLTMQMRGLPIAYLMTVGNQAQTGLSAIGNALLEDERVTAIGLHIEGIDDLKAFEGFALRAQSLGKPIVVLKIGKTEQARAAAASHTAALAGSEAGARALFKRLGIAQVHSLPVLLETLKLAHVTGRLPNSRIASMSCSGGEASLIADIAANRNVSFPPLNDQQRIGLGDALGPKVSLANPLDYHTYIWGDVDAMSRAFAAMMEGDLSLGIVVLDFPRMDRCSQAVWLKVVDAIEIAMSYAQKPIAVLSTLPETLPEDIARDLISRKIIPLSGMDEAIAAIEALAGPTEMPGNDPIHIPAAVIDPELVPEHLAKQELAEFGVRLPRYVLAGGVSDATRAAEAIGYPVVLKGTGLAHKTEAGAVRLNLRTSGEVCAAAKVMPVETFLVEEMVTGATAELLLGVVLDPAHGLVLTIAAGGVLTELLEDSTSLTVPAPRAEIGTALKSLKIARLLAGYRGAPPCDREAIIDAAMAVQSYAMSGPVTEVEINPLLCGENFAIAADALIKRGAPK